MDLKDYLRILQRRWIVSVLTFAAVLPIMLFFSKPEPPPRAQPRERGAAEAEQLEEDER